MSLQPLRIDTSQVFVQKWEADSDSAKFLVQTKLKQSCKTRINTRVACVDLLRSSNGDSKLPVTSLTIDLIVASSVVALNVPPPGLSFGREKTFHHGIVLLPCLRLFEAV